MSAATRITAEQAPEHIDREELKFQAKKVSVHDQVVDELELSLLAHIDPEVMSERVHAVAKDIVKERKKELKEIDTERLLSELDSEIFGFGPLDKLIDDPKVDDILVNNPYEVFVEIEGRVIPSNLIFADEDHLLRIIQRIAGRVGRRVDEVSPMVDARLPDGSRVNAVVRPLTLDGPVVSIRKFGTDPYTVDNLMSFGSITQGMVDFLEAAISSRISFLIAGGTGSGKTTLLNALTRFIPKEERLITIEDSAELILQAKHVIRMETRPPNTEDRGAVTQRDLVRNSLRMRPDRIIVGEVRGAEALDMLQAMNTGHEGSLTTIHANDTRDALARLEMMVAMTGFELPIPVVRQYVAAGIKLIVHLSRLKGGIRRVMRVSEIVEANDGQYNVKDIFGFHQTGIDDDGVAEGHFYGTGYVPACLDRMKADGAKIDESIFVEGPIRE